MVQRGYFFWGQSGSSVLGIMLIHFNAVDKYKIAPDEEKKEFMTHTLELIVGHLTTTVAYDHELELQGRWARETET